MKVITITNLKGGVGKTTTAINLAQRLAKDGYKVLQLDTDHQANMSRFYDAESGDNIHKLFTEATPIRPHVISENLYLIPSDSKTSTINYELINNYNWPNVLRKILQHELYADYFDFCIIDCPPALDMIVANTLTAADYVLIPVTTGQFAYDGLQSIIKRIEETKESTNSKLEVLGIILTMASDRTRASRTLTDHLQEHSLAIKTCHTRIRQCEAFKQAELSHKSIFDYDSKSNGAIDFEMLYQELLTTIKN